MFKDNFLYGFLWGALLPTVGFFALMYLNQLIVEKSLISSEFIGFRDSTVGIVAICLNIPPTTYANRRLLDNFIRGMMVATILAAGAWFFMYGRVLLG